MSALRYAVLKDRGVLALAGEDARAFLQGLVSNDVTKVTPARAAYAALLTPQGKFLHDFFVAEHAGESPRALNDAPLPGRAGVLLIECEKARIGDLKRRLGLYKLRAKVTLVDRSDAFAVAALFGEGTLDALALGREAGAAGAFAGGIVFADPRVAAAGARAIAPGDNLGAAATRAGFAEATADEYDRERIGLGLPDGSRDLEIEKAILLENGFEELNGIDWNKGCYMGQELTARTKYRGLVRKRLMPVEIEGPAPAPGTPVMAGEQEAGEMRSSQDGMGLALLRLDKIEEARAAGIPLVAGKATLTPRKPAWANF
ncbi:MAG: glycine cleavage system protein T [Rhodospirillales bacterium RIFCSPLOWO2_12_FULL_67_15]|nr:MAG: glycine cleavage system protein T [Rhodospirillales bacterium RIFCSPLOWO2_12_FULL_67_15]